MPPCLRLWGSILALCGLICSLPATELPPLSLVPRHTQTHKNTHTHTHTHTHSFSLTLTCTYIYMANWTACICIHICTFLYKDSTQSHVDQQSKTEFLATLNFRNRTLCICLCVFVCVPPQGAGTETTPNIS